MPAVEARTKVLIVEGTRAFAEALRIAIDLEEDLRVVGVATDGESAASEAATRHPDVVILDLGLSYLAGPDAIRRVKATHPQARVVALSTHGSELLLARAVEAGAEGYVSALDGIADVIEAVRRARRGEPLMDPTEANRLLRYLRHRRAQEESERDRVKRLTPRETEILQRMAEGLSREQIATALGLSPNTLRTHVQNVLTKLGVHSKVEALAVAIRHGKVTPGS